MGRSRGGGPRFVSAALAAAVASCIGTIGPIAAASPAGASTAPSPATTQPAAPTSTTLPPIPTVSPAYTNGQSAQTLLSNAISLSSLGFDNSALMSAVAATQARLDADASAARRAQSEAASASRSEAVAQADASSAQGQFSSMAGAVKQAVVFLYTAGPGSLIVSPKAGSLRLFAQDYAASTVGPYGVLARRQAAQHQLSQSLKEAHRQAKLAVAAANKASKALADQQMQLDRLKFELASASASTAAQVMADHFTLAGQAGKDLRADSSLQFAPKSPLPAPVSTTSVALTWAFAELGKDYVWGATGPDTFDCSGLTQFVWKAAGVTIPRVAADQDTWTIPVPLSELLPGDLVFFGTTDIHHVGIYIGNGLMINAPHTGTVVQVSSMWWSDLAGFGRVHYPGTPVPPHGTPTPSQPAKPAVIPGAGPVPSQTAPPAGWKANPGSTTPIAVGTPAGGTPTNGTIASTPATTATPAAPVTSITPPQPPDPVTTTTSLPPVGTSNSTTTTSTTSTTSTTVPAA